jgi:hypothetical protein
MYRMTGLGLLAVLLSACGGSGGNGGAPPFVPPPDGGPVAGHCVDFREDRKHAYFGDLHTHTSYSLDAYFFNAANDPRAAHRFAKGETGGLPGLGSDDPYTRQREVSIGRPLDFNAVTDHAEFLGGFVNTCGRTPQTQQFCDQAIGQGIRDNIVAIAAGDTPLQQQLLQSLIGFSPTNVSAWHTTKQINDEENEPCSFTTLHGYEFSSNELSQMFHRNVIFKGDTARMPQVVFGAVRPDTALNPQNGNDDWDLFDHLNLACKSVPGCDVLTIPHNGNLSDGRMWLPMEPGTGVPLGRKLDSTDVYFPMTFADAQLRVSLDRAVEITQHKGQSECAVGLEGDYLDGEESACDFEINKSVCRGRPDDPASCAQFCTGDPLTDPNFCSHRTAGSNQVDTCVNPGPDGRSRPAGDPDATGTGNCTHPLDYYRNAMAEGLAIRQNLGINPYRANIIAATDTHNGISGNAAERGFVGHGGVLDDEPQELFGFWACDSGDPADPASCSNRRFLDFARTLNPGGLAGVWARENTRDEICAAPWRNLGHFRPAHEDPQHRRLEPAGQHLRTARGRGESGGHRRGRGRTDGRQPAAARAGTAADRRVGAAGPGESPAAAHRHRQGLGGRPGQTAREGIRGCGAHAACGAAALDERLQRAGGQPSRAAVHGLERSRVQSGPGRLLLRACPGSPVLPLVGLAVQRGEEGGLQPARPGQRHVPGE